MQAASVLSQTIESYIDANMILSRHEEEAGGIRSPCKGSHRAGRDIEGWECPHRSTAIEGWRCGPRGLILESQRPSDSGFARAE
jgi:hypothetical protein